MSIYPLDSEQRKTGSRGLQILHSIIDTEHWEFRLETGKDVGRDCILELSEDDQWKNHKIEGQIKGTKKPEVILQGKYISMVMKTSTICYALQSPVAFVLFVVDTTNKIVYYQPIQEYFISNPQEQDKLLSEQKTINIRIPICNTLPPHESKLQRLATTSYNKAVFQSLFPA